MKVRIENAVQQIADTVYAWPSVDSIVLMETELNLQDPYFLISFDVYYSGNLPSEAERLPAFHYAGAFETNVVKQKDRFLFKDLPIRIEYKSQERFTELIQKSPGAREDISYAFYRIQRGRIIKNKSSWISDMKLHLATFGEGFWQEQKTMYALRLQHLLQDLAAAAIKEDRVFFTISLASFLDTACGYVCTVNHEFKPAPRFLQNALKQSSYVPEGFFALFENLTNWEEFSELRLYELAQRLVQKLLQI